MPRKKQDNPQHVDEMDTTTLTNTAANSTSNDTTAAAGYESNTAVASPEGESTIPTATETDEPMAPVLTEETQPGIEQLEIEEEPGCEQLAQITETEWKNVRSSLQGIQKQLQIITMQQFQFMQMMAAKNQQNIVDDVSGMSGENDSGDDTEAKIDSVSRTESPRNEETQITAESELNQTQKEMRWEGSESGSALPLTFTPVIPDGDDSMEEYMEIQKPENSHLEHLVKNMDRTVTDPNQCLICKRILSCKSALMMHYRTHTGERPFKCKLCSRAFTTKGNLKTHMGVHRAKPPLRLLHSCPICAKQFTNALVLNQHMRQHPEEANRKRALEMTAIDELKRQRVSSDLTTEETQPPNRDLEAPGVIPPFLFGGVPSMQDNLRYAEAFARQWEHLSQMTMIPPMVPASMMSQAAAGMRLPFFGQNFQQRFSLPTDLIKQEPPRDSGNEEAMREYPSKKVSDTLSPTQSSTSLTVLTPDKPLDSMAASTSPKSERSSGSNDTSTTSRYEPPPGTTCDICMKTFACRSALEIHYRSHTKQRPFKCDLCDKAFTTRGNMKQHVLTHKTDDMQWSVGERSSQATERLNSVASNGSSEERRSNNGRHQCPICMKNFSSASAVQIHMRTHTGDRPFKCNMCGKAFTTKGNLKVHMGTHMWNAPPSRRGRRLSVENGEAKPEDKETTPNTSPSFPSLNNNSMRWGSAAAMNQSALMKASLLNGQLPGAMFPGYSLFPPTTQAGEEGKPWLWQVTCHVCNKECPSPAALELHIQSHLISENGTSKPVTAS